MNEISKRKVILVGRHTDNVEMGVEVVEQRPITWATDMNTCREQLHVLIADAARLEAEILFQAVPGILAAALAQMLYGYGRDNVDMGDNYMKFGVIVSIPGERAANVERSFGSEGGFSQQEMAEAVRFANARAKTRYDGQYVVVTVDPIPVFQFDHIEWF